MSNVDGGEHIAYTTKELLNEIRGDIKDLRDEVVGEFAVLRTEISDVRHRTGDLEAGRQLNKVYLEQFKDFRDTTKANFEQLNATLDKRFNIWNDRLESLETDRDKRIGSKTMLASVWGLASIAVVNLIINLIQQNLIH